MMMKKGAGNLFFSSVFLLLAIFHPVNAQEYDRLMLVDVAADIGAYRDKTITLKLRLKYEDRIFHKIIFYDRNNTDIVFDIEKRIGVPEYEKMRLNLHEGMEYLVTFTVRDVGKLGLVIGDLKSYTPYALYQLP